MADDGGEDSWVVVESPTPKVEESKEEPSSIEEKVEEPEETVPEPEEAVPEPEETVPEPEPEAEPEVSPEVEAEIQVEQEEKELESEKQAEPEPAMDEGQTESVEVQVEVEPSPEAESEDKPEPKLEIAEPEPEVQQDPSDEHSSSEEPEAAAQQEAEKVAEGASGEEGKGDEAVEVVVDVGAEPKEGGETKEANGEAEVEETPRTPTPEPGTDIKVAEYLKLLKTGTDLQKVRKNKLFPRLYFLESDLSAVAWKSAHKKPNRARIPIACIKEIRPGRGTETFKASSAPSIPGDELCFSIIYANGSKIVNVDLVAYSGVDVTAWVSCIKALIRKCKRGSSLATRYNWLRDIYESADKDGSGSLSVKEVLVLMKELNVGISKKIMTQKFKEADEQGNYDGHLNFEEFCTLFKELSERPEINHLFASYSSKHEFMTTQDIQRFMRIEQGAHNVTPEVVMGFVQRYEPTFEGKEKGWMTLDGFTQFLLGPENDLFMVDHREVYQDMSHPFSHYYLASSHNTYLLEDQLVGPSSIEGYITALRKGCRCVELDCWDGPEGEPIIYHGHTATSKISFQSVIEAVKDHAFAVSSYPVVLSIENHCCVAQQNRMAEIMMEILGDLLYLDARDDDILILPPPSALRNKILIKGKKLSKSIEEAEDIDDGEISEEDEADEMEAEHKSKKSADIPKVEEEAVPATKAETKTEEEAAKPAEGGEEPKAEEKPKEGSPTIVVESADKESKTEDAKAEAAAETKQTEELVVEKEPRRRSIRLSFRSRQRRSRIDHNPTPKKKIKLSKKLSRLINYFQSVHFTNFNEQGKCYQMSSFGENFAVKKISSEPSKFVNYNKHQFSRTYPAGMRVKSSNYDPVPMWNVGCHMVALNYQTTSESMDLNDGKFLQNGGCGYVLKPDILRDENTCYNPNDSHANIAGTYPKVYTIRVISGQNLPKPGDKSGEIVDPYIVLQVVGVKEDRKCFKTKVINDNGFNPEWKETFTFQVAFPELAFLRVSVMDKDINQDDFIGSFSLPMTSIAPGYRHMQLKRGDTQLQCATLFVHVEVYDVITPSRTLAKARTKLRVRKTRQVPEVHLVNFAAIDTLFRQVGHMFRQAVDMQEDFKFALYTFNEVCGHEPYVTPVESVKWMLDRARESNVPLKVGEGKESVTIVRKTSEGKSIPVPYTIHNMVYIFDVFLQTSKTLAEKAEGMAVELEKIRSDALEQKEALKQHLHDSGQPLNYKKTEQVWDSYYKTLFSLKTVAEDLRRGGSEASELREKASAALPEPQSGDGATL